MAIENRFVAVADVLGFSHLVRRIPLADLIQRYEQLIAASRPRNRAITTQDLVTGELRTERTGIDYAVFSDTILLWSGSDQWSVQAFFEHLSALISQSIRFALPLRVGIAYGECEISPRANLYLGSAIVDAHQTEAMQEWIGGACHATCHEYPWFDYYIVHEFDMAVEYNIPTKSGPSLGMVLNWVTPWNGVTELSRDFGNVLESGMREAESPKAKVKWENALTFLHWCFDRRNSDRNSVEQRHSADGVVRRR